MNIKIVGYTVGKLLQLASGIFIIPLLIAIWESRYAGFDSISNSVTVQGFLLASITSLFIGFLLTFLTRDKKQISGTKEGYVIVTLSWIVMAFVGSIPLAIFFISSIEHPTIKVIITCITDAYFETMSGFTTTGATVITNIESLPKSLLFWRSLTHWLGGMGIITLAIGILPALGIPAYQMFKGEVPGPTAERLLPKLAETAKMLWGVYALLSLAEIMLLFFGGMPLFDSVCHTFGTMATGGFSTKNASIGYYDNNYFDWVITIFMFLAGINFIIHYKVILRGQLQAIKKDSELHFYIATVIIAILILTGSLYFKGTLSQKEYSKHFRASSQKAEILTNHVKTEQQKVSTLYNSFRYSAFQVVSIVTTTGYCTADFDMWPQLSRLLLVVLMFFGGCIGSTGGGIKMGRIMLMFKTALREIIITIKPKLIAPLKINNEKIEEQFAINILSFGILFLFIFVVLSLLMTLIISDLPTAITTVIATLNNIGPGLSGVGATQTYAWIPISGKWLLSLSMLLGRLELFTVLVIFSPSTWKK